MNRFQLETPRLRIRLLEGSDREGLEELYLDPDVMRYIPSGIRPVTEEHIDLLRDRFEESAFTVWAVEKRESGEFVGRVGLWPLDQTEEVELGYMLAKGHWGKGYATEASAACLEYGFADLALSAIAAIADQQNHASLHVMEKLAFRYLRDDQFYGMEVRYHRLDAAEWADRKGA